MLCTITLITAPMRGALAPVRTRCLAALAQAGYGDVASDELGPDQALDLTVNAEGPAPLRPLLQEAIAGEADVIVQPATHRRKKLLVADMESTIIEQEMLEEMADVLGKRAEVTEITRRAMNGELDFTKALQARVGLFAGQPASLLERMASRITMMPGAATLAATMKANGAQCWLASGGFRNYTQLVAARLGFDRECANELLIEDGMLTGKVAEPVLDKHTKLRVLQQGVHELKLELRDTITVGDGANDLVMLSACSEAGGLGIAFRAKPSVQAQATYKVNHGDLTALLYAQGYKRAEFVAG